jgi:hypothetical protein
LLFLERIDKVKYDIIDEERKKQAEIQAQKIESARQERK